MKKPLLFTGIIALLVFAGICILALTFHDNIGSDNPIINDTVNGANKTVAAPKAEENAPWVVSGPGPVWKLYTAEDGTVYSAQGVCGNTIKAIAPNGSVKWEYQVSDEWRVSNVLYRPIGGWTPGYPSFIGPVISVNNDTLYVYVRENKVTDFNHYPDEEHPNEEYRDYELKERLMAIKNGQLLFDIPISNEHHSFEDFNVDAQNGRIYVFDDYSITVFDENGSMLFRIGNASSPPAVDENGTIYVVPAIPSTDTMISYAFSRYQNTVYKEPAPIVQAYSANGTLLWQRDIGSNIVRPRVTEELTYKYDTLPLYNNHALYVFTSNGITALDTDGNIKWSKRYDNPINIMLWNPVDEIGNIYISIQTKTIAEPRKSILSPDGHELWNPGSESNQIDGTIYTVDQPLGSSDLYWTGNSVNNTPLILSITSGMNVSAINIISDKVKWYLTIPLNGTAVIMDSNNAAKLLSMDMALINQSPDYTVLDTKIAGIGNLSVIRNQSERIQMTLPINDTVYAYVFDVEYERPTIINRSWCFYSSALCAINKADGKLLWLKSLDALVTSMAANRDTLYYGTRDGNVTGGITKDRSEIPSPVPATVTEDVGKVVGVVAGGAALTAAAVLAIKLFALGGLTRARGQLTANDNRNKTLKFVADHPGSILHEIAHGLGMNVGTVRYHLFILSLNHRIVTFKSDGKYVRYFTNSGSYSKDEQFVLSLVRRNPVRKILNLLLDNPEMSNLEISESLSIHESASSRYMKELADWGVVSKKSLAGGRTSYSICDEYREPVATAIERIAHD